MAGHSESRQAVGIDSVVSNALRQEIHIGFTMNDGSVLVLRLPVGASAPLILRLQSCAAEIALADQDSPVVAQPVRLQSVRPFGLEDGRKGLFLTMGNLEVPLVLSDEWISRLKNELEELPDLRIDTDSRH